ncbi:hypothetical protein AWB64_04284 [Caballeronia sordidicola]|uniref:Uncharacterized protein n=1 Tax=Caballeronia sordidicola TaxID=196367 RepID=A0A158H8M3_CABSO|nr:hypothetical protein AWB64_04284 [Caballeronia sordidicola]
MFNYLRCNEAAIIGDAAARLSARALIYING